MELVATNNVLTAKSQNETSVTDRINNYYTCAFLSIQMEAEYEPEEIYLLLLFDRLELVVTPAKLLGR